MQAAFTGGHYMKKLCAVLTLCLIAVFAAAQDNTLKGKNDFYIFAGAAISKEGIDFAYDNTTISHGKTSFIGGAGYMHYFTKRLGFGMELLFQPLGSDTEGTRIPSPIFYYIYEDTTKSISLMKLFVTGRFTINPQNSLKFYMPFGGGIAIYGGHKEFHAWYYSYYLEEDVTLHKESSFDIYIKPAFYAGLGVEYAFTKTASMAIESRYNSAPLPSALTNSKTLNTIDIFLRFTIRF